MRLNQYLARQTGISRRAADKLIAAGQVTVNGQPAGLGQPVADGDRVVLSGKLVTPAAGSQTIMLHKPVGYVCSRDGQGSATIYDLLPAELHRLKPVGRLDKQSSGLLLLTNDGQLAHKLTHPSFQKLKRYLVRLDQPLAAADQARVTGQGVMLDDGLSRFDLSRPQHQRCEWVASLREGRNRQIRRTFQAIGYRVIDLHRTEFAGLSLNGLQLGQFIEVEL